MVYDYLVGKVAVSDPRFSRNKKFWQQAPHEEASKRWPQTQLTRDDASPFINEDKHRRTRAMYSDVFKPQAIARMADIIKATVESHCSALTTADDVDVVSLIRPIPNAVISRILGIPEETQAEAQFVQAASDYMLAVSPFASDANRDRAEHGIKVIFNIVGGLIDARRAHPEEDLISSLLSSVEYSAESKQDIIVSIATLLSAGTDSSRHSIALAIKTLLQHPAQLQQLQQNPELLDSALLELMRFDFTGKLLPRFLKEDVELHGHLFSRGEMVLTSLQGCGWDPKHYDQPERLDLTRDNKQSLLFGHGQHHCLGFHLAKLQIKETLRYFCAQLPASHHFDSEQLRWEAPDFVLRGLASLPLTLR